jgi:hypothetical protein
MARSPSAVEEAAAAAPVLQAMATEANGGGEPWPSLVKEKGSEAAWDSRPAEWQRKREREGERTRDALDEMNWS